MKGKLIVIEGLDGSGKATQTGMLCEYLEKQGKSVRAVSFPDYKSDSSAPLRMYLRGAFGSDPDSVNPYAASTLFAVDRFASFKTDWESFYNSGGIILADRYTTSNAIHQCSKLPREEWLPFIEWLFDFEYRLMEIPSPDCVIYLRTDNEISQKLLDKRYSSGGHRDIHESDDDYLRRSREAADFCRDRLKWHCIECISGGEMRPAEDIAAEIHTITDNIL